MSNKTHNTASPVRTPKSRKGPKPIRSVSELRESLLADMMSREMRKIDRKIAVNTRKRAAAHARANDATNEINRLTKIREEFIRESGVAPKA